MKKVFTAIFAAALMLIGTEAFAQLSFGAGYINAADKSVVKENVTNSTTTGTVDLNGVYAGASYNIYLGFVDGLGFAPGAFVTAMFGKKNEVNYSDIALNVPVHVTYAYELTPDFKVFGFGGPALSVGLLKKASFTENGTTHTTDYYNKDYDTTFERINVLLGLGCGFEVAELVQVTIGADFGLLPQYKAENSFGSMKYSRPYQLKVGVGYRF